MKKRSSLQLLKKISSSLKQKKKSIALAESCTGGLISKIITEISGSSEIFAGSCVAYSDQAKITLLKIPKKVIVKYGAVSRQVAREMALRVRKILKTDYGLSVTGIAGPRGGTKKKPVGLVFISLAAKKRIIVKKYIFKGSRNKIRQDACREALGLLSKYA